MRTKLSLLMVALLPLAAFGQSAKSKVSVHPPTQKIAVPKSATSIVAYAPAAYCMPELDCSDGDSITNVKFAGINNATTCSPMGYGDFTSIISSEELLAGSTYPIIVTVGDGWWNENVSVWIDYNKNDIFEPSEFTYIGNVANNTSGYEVAGNITIAAGTANGDYRMRVRVAADAATPEDNTLACDEDQFFGETEDYTLKIGVTAPPTGCLTAPNGQWPSTTVTPACNGVVGNVTAAAYPGEYSKLNVISGTAYKFSVSNANYFITIADADGTVVLASGTGSATWTSTLSGVIRFYSHTDPNCGSGTTIHTRSVQCGTIPEPPLACADFKVLSNNLENGGFFNGTTSQRLAIDLPIGSTPFTIYGVEPTVIGTATTFNFKFYSDAAGLPGTLLESRVGTINGSVMTGSNFGYDFYKNTVSFDAPFNAAANTKYWLEIESDAVGWESTSIASMGTKDAFLNNGTSGAWLIGSADYVFNLMCTMLAVNNTKAAQVNFYPNPVKDILTINSKKAIETVHVYNVSGQKMPVSSKVVNGKVDMSKLAPGMYIISTILDGGTNESFKVIKK